MSRHPSTLSFQQVLEEKDPSLALQLTRLKQRGFEDWMGLLHADKGSHASYPHLLNVERLADKIVPDPLKLQFTAGEIFVLLSAIFFHDIGKAISLPGETTPCHRRPGGKCDEAPNQAVTIPDLEQAYDQDEHPPCRRPGWGHHREGERIITEYGVALGLPDERIARYVGLITFCHCLDEPPDAEQPRFGSRHFTCRECTRRSFRATSLAPYGLLRIPLIAAIVRIADETDNIWTRAVRDYWLRRLSEVSADLGKAFRRHIEDIEFCHPGECLLVHVGDHANIAEQGKPLPSEDVLSIQRARESIRQVITSRWGHLLEDRLRVVFGEVYIEHAGCLYTTIPADLRPLPLGEVLQGRAKRSLDELFKAATTLWLGCNGYTSFTWQTLEARIGKPLSDAERWLALRMGSATSDFRLSGDLASPNLTIQITDRKKIGAIREAIFGSEQ